MNTRFTFRQILLWLGVTVGVFVTLAVMLMSATLAAAAGCVKLNAPLVEDVYSIPVTGTLSLQPGQSVSVIGSTNPLTATGHFSSSDKGFSFSGQCADQLAQPPATNGVAQATTDWGYKAGTMGSRVYVITGTTELSFTTDVTTSELLYVAVGRFNGSKELGYPRIREVSPLVFDGKTDTLQVMDPNSKTAKPWQLLPGERIDFSSAATVTPTLSGLVNFFLRDPGNYGDQGADPPTTKQGLFTLTSDFARGTLMSTKPVTMTVASPGVSSVVYVIKTFANPVMGVPTKTAIDSSEFVGGAASANETQQGPPPTTLNEGEQKLGALFENPLFLLVIVGVLVGGWFGLKWYERRAKRNTKS